MTKKSNLAADPILSSGAKPARTRKHAPAKRTTDPVVESSPSTDSITSTAVEAQAESSNPVVTDAPTFDRIAQLAYSYWEARGYQGGSPDEDWLRAERELRNN
jgi:hypothetical protein